MMFAQILVKALKSPKKYINILFALMRGTYYLVLYRLINNKISIAFPFYSHSPVRIIGPGTVVIGKSSRALLNNYKGLTIVTKSPDSVVKIGDRCSLGGLTIRCNGNISLGDKVMTALSLIQDSYYGNLNAVARNHDHVSSFKDINIGNNVWISGQCVILGGCKIGNDSVLSFGACCHDMEIGDYKLITGNPAKRPLPIDNVLQLMGIK